MRNSGQASRISKRDLSVANRGSRHLTTPLKSLTAPSKSLPGIPNFSRRPHRFTGVMTEQAAWPGRRGRRAA